jgi:universal stress protein A
MSRRRAIVHPTDFSRGSDVAFTRALDQARREEREVILVHVLESVQDRDAKAAGGVARTISRDAEVRARQRMDVLLDRAKDMHVTASDIVTDGDAAEEIVNVVKKLSAGLIVMGTHGRTGLTRVLLGSVAARVVKLAPCPVVTVRRP